MSAYNIKGHRIIGVHVVLHPGFQKLTSKILLKQILPLFISTNCKSTFTRNYKHSLASELKFGLDKKNNYSIFWIFFEILISVIDKNNLLNEITNKHFCVIEIEHFAMMNTEKTILWCWEYPPESQMLQKSDQYSYILLPESKLQT